MKRTYIAVAPDGAKLIHNSAGKKDYKFAVIQYDKDGWRKEGWYLGGTHTTLEQAQKRFNWWLKVRTPENLKIVEMEIE